MYIKFSLKVDNVMIMSLKYNVENKNKQYNAFLHIQIRKVQNWKNLLKLKN